MKTNITLIKILKITMELHNDESVRFTLKWARDYQLLHSVSFVQEAAS